MKRPSDSWKKLGMDLAAAHFTKIDPPAEKLLTCAPTYIVDDRQQAGFILRACALRASEKAAKGKGRGKP